MGGFWARLRRRWRSRRVVVRDASMRPALEPGDRLLVDPVEPGGPQPRDGDVIVLRDPLEVGRLLVKRVTALPRSFATVDPALATRPVFVIGDAPGESRDSRSFGPVPARDIVGLVWFRYLPRGRRGPIPNSGELAPGKP